ncbi:unnamed protein product [Adineta ricciae]|uniref:Uncharacterized protein n=1 Tax=Adineta ricciae TaxID=249248 RepID=A0A815ARI9_ADIRI|nr:unnamed protein product [Adineta ricciae]
MVGVGIEHVTPIVRQVLDAIGIDKQKVIVAVQQIPARMEEVKPALNGDEKVLANVYNFVQNQRQARIQMYMPDPASTIRKILKASDIKNVFEKNKDVLDAAAYKILGPAIGSIESIKSGLDSFEDHIQAVRQCLEENIHQSKLSFGSVENQCGELHRVSNRNLAGNLIVGRIFAECIGKFMKKNNNQTMKMLDDCIDQTITHPIAENMCAREIGKTEKQLSQKFLTAIAFI